MGNRVAFAEDAVRSVGLAKPLDEGSHGKVCLTRWFVLDNVQHVLDHFLGRFGHQGDSLQEHVTVFSRHFVAHYDVVHDLDTGWGTTVCQCIKNELPVNRWYNQ